MRKQTSIPIKRFSATGHKTIGSLAYSLLQPKAKKAVDKLLAQINETNLNNVATWADTIKGKKPSASMEKHTQDFLTAFPNTREWHYVDLPANENAYNATTLAAFTREDDVVHITIECINILLGKSAKFSKPNALRWLVHLIGDIHQPLHIGCSYVQTTGSKVKLVFDADTVIKNNLFQKSDHGGNFILLPNNKKLHEYWDDYLVTQAKKGTSFQGKVLPTVTEQQLIKLPAQWASDTLQYSKIAYNLLKVLKKSDEKIRVVEVDFNQEEYDKVCVPITKQNLENAGNRLAQLLNSIYE